MGLARRYLLAMDNRQATLQHLAKPPLDCWEPDSSAGVVRIRLPQQMDLSWGVASGWAREFTSAVWQGHGRSRLLGALDEALGVVAGAEPVATLYVKANSCDVVCWT